MQPAPIVDSSTEFSGSDPTELKVEDSTGSLLEPKLLNKVLREPLVHFILIGVALFLLYGAFAPEDPLSGANRIALTEDDIDQLRVSWAAQWQRPPTSDELKGLIDEKVQKEIFYREGMALGLDQDDEIIKRRMAQKMEFLAEDVSNEPEPSRDELKTWFEKNSARFALPGLITFRHLYFSPDKRGEGAKNDAEQALAKLKGNSADGKAAVLGDRFMFQDYYSDSSPEQLAKIFGTQFSDTVFQQKPGAWHGPVESGLGWHLVFIETMTPDRVPAFDVADLSQIRSQWMADKRAAWKRDSFEVMKRRYEIVLPSRYEDDEVSR